MVTGDATLSAASPGVATDHFAALRTEEFPLLAAEGLAYLDYTGAAVPPKCLIDAHHDRLSRTVLGNPHSEHAPSLAATRAREAARARVLAEVGANPDEHTVVFTPNASAALRLVGEAFPFSPDRPFVIAADNHNSVVGIRRFALARGAAVEALPLDDDLRLDDPAARIDAVEGSGLVAFPAQSNFSGVRHPLELVRRAHDNGHRVLLDAAAYLPVRRLDLGAVPADFVAFSAYKIFGYPTGVGALVARRDALGELERPWFAGGTVEFVSVRHGVHRLVEGPEGFEDGTPDFLAVPGLEAGFDFMERVGWTALDAHVEGLTEHLLAGLDDIRHSDGRPAVVRYGPGVAPDRGCSVAFNVVAPSGGVVPFSAVVHAAAREDVAVRGGCFCNPGASEASFGFAEPALGGCLQRFSSGPFAPERLADCLGGGPVGAVRASPGMACNEGDVDRLLEIVAEIAEQAAA